MCYAHLRTPELRRGWVAAKELLSPTLQWLLAREVRDGTQRQLPDQGGDEWHKRHGRSLLASNAVQTAFCTCTSPMNSARFGKGSRSGTSVARRVMATARAIFAAWRRSFHLELKPTAHASPLAVMAMVSCSSCEVGCVASRLSPH